MSGNILVDLLRKLDAEFQLRARGKSWTGDANAIRRGLRRAIADGTTLSPQNVDPFDSAFEVSQFSARVNAVVEDVDDVTGPLNAEDHCRVCTRWNSIQSTSVLIQARLVDVQYSVEAWSHNNFFNRPTCWVMIALKKISKKLPRNLNSIHSLIT